MKIFVPEDGNNKKIEMKENLFETMLEASRIQAKDELENGNSRKRRKTQKPYFLLVGRVDGISHQLDLTDPDPSTWTEIKVVVEMKSRVRRISSPPPLYEQIQLVSSQGETTLIALSSPDPSLVITMEELAHYFHVTVHYDTDTQILRVDAVSADPQPFRTRYPIPRVQPPAQ